MTTQEISPELDTLEAGALEEVRRRRVLAFCVDYLIIAVLSFVAGVIVFVLGIVTLGLAWLLYGAVIPLVTLLYFGITLSRDAQASPGMRLFSLEVKRENGLSVDFLFAVMHTILFWVGNMILPVIILAVSLFSSKKRLAHDILLGSLFIRTDL